MRIKNEKIKNKGREKKHVHMLRHKDDNNKVKR